jgi:hypothetical protein
MELDHEMDAVERTIEQAAEGRHHPEPRQDRGCRRRDDDESISVGHPQFSPHGGPRRGAAGRVGDVEGREVETWRTRNDDLGW